MGSICFPALGFLNSQLISLGSPDELPLGRLLHARPVDLANEKNPRIFETQLESFTRARRFNKDLSKPILLSDYLSGQSKTSDDANITRFIEDVHKKVLL